MLFRITFSSEWILSKRNSDILPADMILDAINREFTVSNPKSRISECEGIISVSSPDDKASVHEKITDIINKTYNIDESDNIYSVELMEYVDAPENTEEAPEPEEAQGSGNTSENDSVDTETDHLRKISDLVGADEFKQLAAECSKMAKDLIENNIVDSFTSRSYIVSINEGCGLTTYLEAFADLIANLGLFEFRSKTRVAEEVLAPPDTKGMENPFSAALSHFQGRNSGKIVCIDISEWMTKLTDKEFREFLKQIDRHTGENIVFFRVPFVERNIISDIQKSLNDILFVTAISIPPFTNEELMKCAENILSDKGYSVDSDSWEVFSARVASEKSDGRFYGINTIRKIVREMLYIKQLHDIDNGISSKVIHRNDILPLADNDSISQKSGFEQLEELVGMDSIQKQVREVVAQIEASVSNNALDTPCIHMRFVGNPGTGKTTVARIVGTILKEKGILRNGSFFEHSGRDLCGRFVGETAPKTSAICRDAYGSVLFIDEAYSLYRDDSFSTADYGREAIDTLVAEMENHRSDLMVIMAGYPDEMNKMMTGNIGLKSRMPYLIEFPNYTREQLADIFFTMAKKGFSYDDSFSEAVRSYFASLSDEIMKAKDFSNARFVRNLFERTWAKAALRSQMNQSECTSLTVEDFALATADKEFHNIMEQKKRTIGFN